MTARETLARELTNARDRTLRLVDFDDAELGRQYDPLMSPLVWDLAHIGQQEELWLLRDGNPDRPGMLAPEVERLYDAFVNSRASRVNLPLLPPHDARAYCATVRNKVLDSLDSLTDDPGSDAAFNFGLVISHENQHDETMLQALNLRVGPPLLDHHVGEQPFGGLVPDALEAVEDPTPHVRDEGPRLVRTEQRQADPAGAWVLEGVVELFDLAREQALGRGVAPSQQPEVLLLADVREVPHQRAHQRAVLGGQLGLVEVGQPEGAGARGLEAPRGGLE